ncbi:Rho GTPase-activating protein 1 [Striga hermonthica]|uniref:Rho GTPase-activating protein 1 n=1 Tax=Striga hermonthica TaxID=68872 RepID=A0A9N7N116_STRHE|nr:Rho GTPase-activating protein 1 [Striga hermonthica]
MCITPAVAVDNEPFVSAASELYCFRKLSSPSIGKVFEADQISLLELLVAIFRRSFVGCKRAAAIGAADGRRMEIGSPSNVRHVAHVTFDRFNGFLGLPVEFEPEVPRRPPSASTRVFGVSTESMQLSFDSRGNCVPTILLMMQRRLYMQGGLESEGIFRINPANGQEEYVREQLNNGLIPDDIDVHCLAGLIKAWFRELPRGVLDCVPAEQVMEAQSEDECTQLVRLLPPTEAALLDWAVNLMADVAQHEHLNKMNPRNIAMVFAPNMTQMSDPLTALMYAVQVMNFLKTLVTKTLREREDSLGEAGPTVQLDQENEDHHDQCTSGSGSGSVHTDQSIRTNNESCGFLSSIEKIIADAKGATDDYSIADKEGSWQNTLRPVVEGDEGITVTTKLKPQPSRGEAWK